MHTSDAPVDLILAELTADRDALRAAVDAVPRADRTRRPGPGLWSVADVVEHLAIVEERAVAILRDLAAKAPPLAGGGASGGYVALDRALLRDRTQRVEAPEPIRPGGGMDVDAAWRRLERSRQALASALREASDRDLGAVERIHPRLGALTGWQWVAALGGHEERHTAQVREIGERLAAAQGAHADARTT